jgi:hypothetical protein
MSNNLKDKAMDEITNFIAGLTDQEAIAEIRKYKPYTKLKYLLTREDLEYVLANLIFKEGENNNE